MIAFPLILAKYGLMATSRPLPLYDESGHVPVGQFGAVTVNVLLTIVAIV